ncbi:MAG: gliding motility-associated ABC transporter permease subunit GldF [Bacteroidales bacterium]|nr:gliding motility-associated ABC transporter permease subunit GldF [Bacteroidales bacterium]
MYVMFLKEFSSFLSSLIGYIIMIVFLATMGLFLWILPTEFNVIDFGYASIDGLFILSPWFFLFIIPAITMKMFAEEKKNGTIELLLTKPISDISLILSKFFAGLCLVILTILPTLIYIIAVYNLGSPAGNLDLGGIIGSYIGLIFLSGVFVSIGIFSSSLTNNQIVAFIISVLLCAFCYIGFDAIASLQIFGNADLIIRSLGILQHYTSISRGVIDSRDVIYYISAIVFFILLTKISLESRKWKK